MTNKELVIMQLKSMILALKIGTEIPIQASELELMVKLLEV